MSFWLYLIYPLLAYLAIVFVKDFICLQRMKHYVKQGFVRMYVPFLGPYLLLNPSSTRQRDGVALLKDKVQTTQNENAPGVVSNDNYKNRANIMLTDTKLIREFFLKEVEVCHRTDLIKLPVNFPFFWENTEEALQKRTIFAEFFRVDNLSSCIPEIVSACKENIDRLKQSLASSSDKKEITIDMKKEMVTWIECITENTLFANKSHKFSVEGSKVAEVVCNAFSKINSYEGVYHMSNYFSYGLAAKLGLVKGLKIGMELYNKAEAAVKKAYQERSAMPDKDLQTGILDLMVKYNRSKPQFLLSESDAIGYMVTFMFAGVDTTSRTLQSGLYFLALDKDLQKRIRDDVKTFNLRKSDLKFEDLDQSEALNGLFKETLRLMSPAPITFERRIMKDFTLGEYSFNKGDTILIPLAGMMAAKSCTDDPHTFDISRYSKDAPQAKKVNPQCYMPFSLGRRNCVGQLLAELEFKVAVINFISEFEIELPKGDNNHKWVVAPLYEIDHLKVNLRSAPK